MKISNILLLVFVLLEIETTAGTITIESIIPNFGPYRGGINLTILVDLGYNVERITTDKVSIIFVDSQNVSIPCKPFEKQQIENKLYIHVTSPEMQNHNLETMGKIIINFAGNSSEEIKIESTFHFKPNPTVGNKFVPFATTISGGIKVTLTGEHLISSEKTYLRAVGIKGSEIQWSTQESCEIVSTIEIKCLTSRLVISEDILKDLDRSEPLHLSNLNQVIQFSLTLDGQVHHIDPPDLYLDPIIEAFQEDRIFVVDHGSRRIYIEGKWPTPFPSLEENIHIQVGGKHCLEIRRDNQSHVSCSPPSMESHVIRYGLPDVTTLPVKVKVGNSEHVLGMLKYEEVGCFLGPITLTMIVILSIIISISVVFAIQATCASRKMEKYRIRNIPRRTGSDNPDSDQKNIIFAANDNNNIDDDNDDNLNKNKKGGEMNISKEKGESHELESLMSPENKGRVRRDK